MTTVVLDTHVVQWWSAEPERLSSNAREAVMNADELAIAAISWFELAWLAAHDRILVDIPSRSWLDQLSDGIRTLPLSPAIAAAAATLPSSFPGDPADRLIYATAIEHGFRLITKDRRLLDQPSASPVGLW